MQISDIKAALSLGEASYDGLPIHVAALCAFMIEDDRARLSAMSVSGETPHSYKESAAIGYRLAAGEDNEVLKAAFCEDVEHLSGRTFFAEGRAPRFEIDGVALLGIAFGLRAIDAPESDRAWLSDLLERSVSTLTADERQHSLVLGAQGVLGDVAHLDAADIKLRASVGAVGGRALSVAERGAAWRAMIETLTETDAVDVAINRKIFDMCAAALAALPVNGAGVDELVALLEGVSQSMSHWTYEQVRRVKGVDTQKWEIEHEYHVQNLLWTLLRPVFRDLVDEGSLPKVGHLTPRYDLGVPSLETIIEVKFMRRPGRAECKKITEEIAADRSFYLGPKTGYSKMVAFIWDECRQTEEYRTLCDGLEGMEGIEKVVILPRPARMERERNDEK